VEKPEETAANLEREAIQRILTDHRWRCLAPNRLRCWNRGLGWFAGGVCRRFARCFDIDSSAGWIKAADLACSPLTTKDVDIILASGPPFASFKLAKRLSDKFDRPYVLDYRDTWTVDPHGDRPARRATIQNEARLLADCSAVTVVSRSWGSVLDRDFGVGRKLHIITNGYDAEELVAVRPHHFNHFAIVYAGTFYPPKRVISPVMAALKLLNETINGRSGEWYFHYYGQHENHVRQEAMRFDVMERIVLHGTVSRAEALSAILGAGVVVVITSVLETASLEDKGIVTGKIFEVLGLGAPILLIAPPGSDTEHIVADMRLGRSFTGNDVDGITSFFTDAMCGRAHKPKAIEAYSWSNIAKKFDAVLRGALRSTKQTELLS
jgi:glycosyltransferase involved in cell wall biosynthesis